MGPSGGGGGRARLPAKLPSNSPAGEGQVIPELFHTPDRPPPNSRGGGERRAHWVAEAILGPQAFHAEQAAAELAREPRRAEARRPADPRAHTARLPAGAAGENRTRVRDRPWADL